MNVASLIEKLFPRGAGGGRSGPVWIVAGLGNPDPQYRHTRHNIGWWVIDELAARTGAGFRSTRGVAHTAEVEIAGQRAVLARPTTYVNRSGGAIRSLLRKHSAAIERLIVVCDDLNLGPGKVRIRRQGGAGGHNGMTSIIQALGSEEFTRIRIGIGRPVSGDEQVDYVLGRPAPAERKLIDDAVIRSADAVEAMIAEGIDEAMNRFNG